MAYVPYYTCNFHNELNELVEITIYKKDGDPDTVPVNYPCTNCELSRRGDNDDVFDTIITSELTFKMFIAHNDTSIDWETIMVSGNDEYKIHMDIDGQPVFDGFLVPDEGATDFQDKPYELTFKCTDGLRLLQQVALTEIDGNPFDCGTDDGNVNDLMAYVCTCLGKLNLGLQIRFYCNIFEESFPNRSVSVESDAFNNAKTERRAFSKDVNTMKSCWDVLQAILYGFRLSYWDGMWVIQRIGELQYLPGSNYYTQYNADRSLVDGASQIDTEGYAQIGKNEMIYPVNVNQLRSARFAAKTVKHTFPYNVWEEIPANNKFDRGTFFDTGDQPDTYDSDDDDDTSEIIGIYKRYTPDCWTYGKNSKGGFPNLFTTTALGLRRSVSNNYGIEVYRQIELEAEVTGNSLFCVLMSAPVPITKGDKVGISFQYRVETDGGLTGISASYVFIVPDGGGPILYLDNNNGVKTDECLWEAVTGNLQLQFNGADPTLFFTFSANSVPAPVSGKLYFALHGGNTAIYGNKIFKDFNITYIPFINGGYLPITGHYWLRTNPGIFQDAIDLPTGISNTLNKIIKGSLLRLDGETLTKSWYREGLTEIRDYQELINLALYNLKYRRFWKIEGDFKGTTYKPENESPRPFSFHKLYRFMDISEEKYFMACTPYRLNILTGIFSGNFIEVKDANIPGDGTQEPTAISNYTFSNA